jgi:protein TonB
MLESVLSRSAQRRPLGRGAVLSLLAHATLIGIVVYVSSRPRVDENATSRAVTFFNPPPPPPPPPPAGGRSSPSRSTPRKQLQKKPNTLVKAEQKPVEPQPTPPEETASKEAEGVEGGVKGGVAGGVVGGEVGGVVGGVVGGQLGNPPRPSSGVLPFGAGMTRPTLVTKREPAYPREALVAKIGGLMLVKCIITTEGSLRACRIVKGLPYMDQPVLAALAAWKYTPVLFQGSPVSVEYVIPVRLVPP